MEEHSLHAPGYTGPNLKHVLQPSSEKWEGLTKEDPFFKKSSKAANPDVHSYNVVEKIVEHAGSVRDWSTLCDEMPAVGPVIPSRRPTKYHHISSMVIGVDLTSARKKNPSWG